MKFLGIDYGAKRIGLATSDEEGSLAFPEAVIENNNQVLANIKDLCLKKGIGEIVLGESINLAGEPNKIMKDILIFRKKLEDLKLPIRSQKEFMTSHLAEGLKKYLKEPAQNRARKTKQAKEPIDASAAALILQRYLDKQKHAI